MSFWYHWAKITVWVLRLTGAFAYADVRADDVIILAA
jgi:hypothetical protein